MREGEEVENSGKLVMHVHFTLQSARSFQLISSIFDKCPDRLIVGFTANYGKVYFTEFIQNSIL